MESQSLNSFESDEEDSTLSSNDSIVLDVRPIFDKQYKPEQIEQIKAKSKVKLASEKPYWTDYEESCRVLERGIQCTKYNFSNEHSREVTLRLVNNRTAIEYRSQTAPNTFLKRVFVG